MVDDERSDGGRNGGEDAENIRKRGDYRYTKLHETWAKTKRRNHHGWETLVPGTRTLTLTLTLMMEQKKVWGTHNCWNIEY